MTKMEYAVPSNRRKMERNLYYYFVFFGILYLLQRYMFEEYTINGPGFFYYISFAISIAYVVLNPHKLLLYNAAGTKKLERVLVISFNFLKYFITFFFVAASLLMSLFGISNKIYSMQNPLEEHKLKILNVSQASTDQMPYLEYEFNGYKNSFSGSLKIYKMLNKNSLCYFRVWCREGMFGSFVIENWTIEN